MAGALDWVLEKSAEAKQKDIREDVLLLDNRNTIDARLQDYTSSIGVLASKKGVGSNAIFVRRISARCPRITAKTGGIL